MRDIFESIVYTWFVFCLCMIPILWYLYDGRGDLGELYFKDGNSIYYVGYLEEIQ